MFKSFEKVVCLAHSSLSHHIAALADLGTLLGSLESIRANWYNFGLQLRVDIGILDGIAVQYPNPLDCLRETLKHWLKTSPNCTWKCIVDALSSPIVVANVLALDLERKPCPQLDTHTPLAQTPYTQEQVLYRQASTPTLPQGPPAAKRPCYGNGQQDSCTTSPGSSRHAITVAGTRNGDGLYLLGSGTNHGACVDIFAPGESILAADFRCHNCSKYLSGTSMAAPLVSGVAAIHLSQEPLLTPSELKQKLINESIKNVIDYTGMPSQFKSRTPNRLVHLPGECCVVHCYKHYIQGI